MLVVVFDTSKLRAQSQVFDDVDSGELQPTYHVNVGVALSYPLKLIYEWINMTGDEFFLTAKCLLRKRMADGTTLPVCPSSGAVKRIWTSGRRRV